MWRYYYYYYYYYAYIKYLFKYFFCLIQCHLWWSPENKTYCTKIGSLSYYFTILFFNTFKLIFFMPTFIFILKSLEQNLQNQKHNDWDMTSQSFQQSVWGENTLIFQQYEWQESTQTLHQNAWEVDTNRSAEWVRNEHKWFSRMSGKWTQMVQQNEW